jgi:hypothetical protein
MSLIIYLGVPAWLLDRLMSTGRHAPYLGDPLPEATPGVDPLH